MRRRFVSRARTVPAIIGGAILLLLVVAAIFADQLAPNAADQDLLSRLDAPTWAGGLHGYLFGSDNLGRDVFARMIQGAVRAQEVNPAKLAQLYRREFQLCQARKGETIAVVSDLATRREYVQAAFAAADDLGADIYELCVNLLGPNAMIDYDYTMRRSEQLGLVGPPGSSRKMFLRSRANSIEGGTSEIQRNILGERVLGLPGEPRTDKDIAWSAVPRS